MYIDTSIRQRSKEIKVHYEYKLFQSDSLSNHQIGGLEVPVRGWRQTTFRHRRLYLSLGDLVALTLARLAFQL